MKELIQVQRELKVGKDNTKQGINFSYRTVDDILEALKGVMPKNCFVTMVDDVREEGGRVYIYSVATFSNGNESQMSTGFAREPEKLAAMSMPQITGSCSSYARKAALCGLFMIDDSKDVDSLTSLETGGTAGIQLASKKQIEDLTALYVAAETVNVERAEYLDSQIKDPNLSFAKAAEILRRAK